MLPADVSVLPSQFLPFAPSSLPPLLASSPFLHRLACICSGILNCHTKRPLQASAIVFSTPAMGNLRFPAQITALSEKYQSPLGLYWVRAASGPFFGEQ